MNAAPLRQLSLFTPVAPEPPRRRNVVIEAGAGTGKTTAIVAEVLRILLGETDVAPERIVLVTFTEKAAGEIADRIRDALRDIHEEGLTSWPAGSSHPLFTADAAAVAACERQLARIDSLRSQTIHSFCQSLLRQYPIEAGLDPQFAIIEGFERALLHGEIYDAWIDRETRVAPDRDCLREWELLAGNGVYLFQIREAILELVGRRDLIDDLSYDCGSIAEFESQLLDAVATIRACGDDASRITRYLRSVPSPEAGAEIDAWIDFLAPIAHDVRTEKLGRGPSKEALKVLRWGDMGKSAHDRLASHRAAMAILRLARRFVSFLDDEKRQRGVVDFDDLLLRTAAVLENETVLDRVRQQFDFIFVDEFQDTDRTQARILDLLGRDRDGALVPGRMIVVGDPKQSIYGFRRADPETFDRFTRSMIAAGAEHRLLRDQYRSERPLLDAVNAIFSVIFAEELLRDPNVFRPSYHPLIAAKGGDANEARITLLHGGDPDAPSRTLSEGEQAAEWIAMRGGDLRQYAMLFRRGTKLDDYLDALDRYGIPYVLPPTRLFLDRPAAVDLVSVLRAIAYPFDRGAAISAARSPYFALTDLEISRSLLCHPERERGTWAGGSRETADSRRPPPRSLAKPALSRVEGLGMTPGNSSKPP